MTNIGSRPRGFMRAMLTAAACLLSLALALIFTSPARAGTAPSVIENRPIGLPARPVSPARAASGRVAAPERSTVTPPPAAPRRFVLSDVTVTGAGHLPRAAVRATWAGLRGHVVTLADISGIADRLSALCSRAGFAICRVAVPGQPFAGSVRIDVTLGSVAAVSIEGQTRGSNLWLLRAYAAAIVADHPLREATLEREVLLMNAIPGLTVGSRFAPDGIDGVRLVLTIARKRFEYGVGFDNAGQTALGRVELEANIAVNDLFGEGDRTQLVFGLPAEVKRFQYVGLTHVEPLGTDGATVTFNAADLLTHPIHDTVAGNAVLFGGQLADPLVRRVHETLLATFGFDALNSDSALLGRSLSDERTRSLRAGLRGAADQWLGGLSTVDLVASQGIDVLGARRGSVFAGGPVYTKLTARLTREQPLPGGFVGRLKGYGQWSAERLPASEEFAFGGLDFGQAFPAVTLTGDRALAGAVELARPLPPLTATRWTSAPELFALVDWGEVWNAPSAFVPRTDRGASAAGGLRVKLLGRVTLQAEAAHVLVRPVTVAATGPWRGVVGITGTF